MIKLTDVCKWYRNLEHQNKALNYLKSNIDNKVLWQFARKFRNNDDGSDISLINVAKFWDGTPHQVEAINFLQESIPPSVLEEFAKQWRTSIPPKTNPSSFQDYYRQMTHNGERMPQWEEDKRNIERMCEALMDIESFLEKTLNKDIRLELTSGYRPEPINSQVGGVPNSKHVTGEAADFWSPDVDDQLLEDLVFQYWYEEGRGGVGLGMNYRGFVHVDLGPVRYWNY